MVEISIIPYKYSYLSKVQDLFLPTAHTAYDLTQKALPKIGFIALINKQPIGTGFLRRIEPCYAQIDTLTTLPYFGKEAREEALKRIIEALIQSSEEMKIKAITSVIAADKWTMDRVQGLIKSRI